MVLLQSQDLKSWATRDVAMDAQYLGSKENKRIVITLLLFKFSSSACREEISAGSVVMELLERSNRSNSARPQNTRGKLDSLFDARCTSLRWFSNVLCSKERLCCYLKAVRL